MTTLNDLREAVRREPASGAARYALGIALACRGEYAAAIDELRASVAAVSDPAAHRALGYLLSRDPECEDEALVHLARAARAAPASVDTREALAAHLLTMRRFADARAQAQRVIADWPNRPSAYLTLCRACLAESESASSASPRRGRQQTAAHGSSPAAPALAPAPAPAIWMLVLRAKPDAGREDHLALALAQALMDVGRYGDAEAWLLRQPAGVAGQPRWLALRGRVADVLGDPDAARRCYEQALSLTPEDASAINRYLMLLWQCGDYARVRQTLRRPETMRGLGINPDSAFWDRARVRGRSLLLRQGDCGYGDNLQWNRVAPLLQAAGARVTIECLSPVQRLLQTMPGVDRVVAPGDAGVEADVVCNPVHAIKMLEWDWTELHAQIPFLHVPAASRAHWRAQLDACSLVGTSTRAGAGASAGFGVGGAAASADNRDADTYVSAAAAATATTAATTATASAIATAASTATAMAMAERPFHLGIEWSSETEHRKDDPHTRRSASADLLRPLTELPGVICHSLHVGAGGRRELRASGLPIRDLSAGFGDFVDTAAAVAALDAVVSVDSAAVHVAGALGRPVFLMLPSRGDWRWGDEQTRASWYPSCRIVRQRTPGDWTTVIAAVADAIRVLRRREGAADAGARERKSVR